MHGIEIDEKVFYYSSHSPHSFHHHSGEPNLLIFGGIHGNEPCGIYAINRFMREIDAGMWSLKQGSITFAYGNLAAIKNNTRYVDYNMNRMFGLPQTAPQAIEYARVRLLERLIPNKTAMLDLHSALTPAPDFMLAESIAHPLAKALQPTYLVSGWESFATVTGDTECYGLSLGVTAVTYEAGQHDDAKTLEHAYEMLLRFLNHYHVIDYAWTHTRSMQHLVLKQVIHKQSHQDQWLIPIHNFMSVHKGQEILRLDGVTFHAPFDAYLVFPVPVSDCQIDEELTFLAFLHQE